MPALELPDVPQPRVSPELLVGAASPLWGYFGAAAVGGVAYWWMTRAFKPMNLEAVFGAAAHMAEPALLPVLEAAEVAAEVVAEEPVMLVAAAEEVATESPPVAAFEAEPAAEPAPEPVEAAAPDPEAAADAMLAEPPADAVITAAPEAEAPEAVAAEPATFAEAPAPELPEPIGKPRVRKAVPPPTPQA